MAVRLAPGQVTGKVPGQVAEKPAHAQPAGVGGDWQVSWQGRLGAEQCALHLQQEGAKLTGSLKTLRGLSSLSGTVDEKRISFDVKFEGPRPFTTRFTGIANGGKIEGTSQAVDVGGSGAYLGHGGEIVQPDHPWTATRVEKPPSASASGETGPNSNFSARK
jgi:hypothetical protein